MTEPTPPQEPEELQPEEQLGLFGEASNAPIQPTRRARKAPIQRAGLDDERLDSYKALTASLTAKNADSQGIAIVIGTIYKAGFGKATAELHAHFGLTSNNRAALPAGILRILIVYELAAKRRVDRHIMQAQTQTEINRELAQQCRIATQIIEKGEPENPQNPSCFSRGM